MTRTLCLEYWMDDGWYVGRLKEAPGVFSQGRTLPELELNIRDAFLLVVNGASPAPTTDVSTREIVVTM